jgi:hypothetical protein
LRDPRRRPELRQELIAEVIANSLGKKIEQFLSWIVLPFLAMATCDDLARTPSLRIHPPAASASIQD